MHISLIISENNFINMKGHGARLRKYLDAMGIKYGVVCERMGIHRNTLRGWMNEPDALSLEALERLIKQFPDIMEHFPDVEWKKTTWAVSEPNLSYGFGAELDTLCQKELARMKDLYLSLLESHNELKDRYIALLTAQP